MFGGGHFESTYYKANKDTLDAKLVEINVLIKPHLISTWDKIKKFFDKHESYDEIFESIKDKPQLTLLSDHYPIWNHETNRLSWNIGDVDNLYAKVFTDIVFKQSSFNKDYKDGFKNELLDEKAALITKILIWYKQILGNDNFIIHLQECSGLLYSKINALFEAHTEITCSSDFVPQVLIQFSDFQDITKRPRDPLTESNWIMYGNELIKKLTYKKFNEIKYNYEVIYSKLPKDIKQTGYCSIILQDKKEVKATLELLPTIMVFDAWRGSDSKELSKFKPHLYGFQLTSRGCIVLSNVISHVEFNVHLKNDKDIPTKQIDDINNLKNIDTSLFFVDYTKLTMRIQVDSGIPDNLKKEERIQKYFFNELRNLISSGSTKLSKSGASLTETKYTELNKSSVIIAGDFNLTLDKIKNFSELQNKSKDLYDSNIDFILQRGTF
jgi:hypothetical protein